VNLLSLLDAVRKAGRIPGQDEAQAIKKRYSEVLSGNLAAQLAALLRDAGFSECRPLRDGPGEVVFQGGLGPKKVDVSYSDSRNGLLLAVSIKTITAPPFNKNLKNRFSDLCTESMTLHMRFPYSIVCALFAFPSDADADTTRIKRKSTFLKARTLLATISGRENYADPGEKFENVTLMLFQPAVNEVEPWVRFVDCDTGKELTEDQYIGMLVEKYNDRNPHAMIGEPEDVLEV